MKQLTLFLFTLSISVLAAINKPPTQVTVKENIPVIITKKISVSEKATNVANKETTNTISIISYRRLHSCLHRRWNSARIANL